MWQKEGKTDRLRERNGTCKKALSKGPDKDQVRK
jgi:hypothetical protein